MKCPHCGAPIGIEEEYCSYCGQKNLMSSKHQADMQHYKNEFSKTQNTVYEHTKHITTLTVPVIFLAVMVILNVAAVIFFGKAWDISSAIAESRIEKNAAMHRQKLEELLEHQDYIGFEEYYSGNDLYLSDIFNNYRAIESACSNLSFFYTTITEIYTEPDSYYLDEENLNSTLRNISQDIEEIFSVKDDYCYNPELVTGQAADIIEDIQTQTKALLVAYCGLTREEADDFSDLSRSNQYKLLERGLQELCERR